MGVLLNYHVKKENYIKIRKLFKIVKIELKFLELYYIIKEIYGMVVRPELYQFQELMTRVNERKRGVVYGKYERLI
jgi:hypothetical protein